MIKYFLKTFLIWIISTNFVFSAEKFITLASTTSTQNSGLYDYILPKFTSETGIKVRVIAVGTGQAIKIAENGDADVLLVHHRQSEDLFIANGFGLKRFDVMYNDFIIIGPKEISEKKSSLRDLIETFETTGAYPFISRGDDSGTHKKELELWQKKPTGKWYREIGSGMGATLNMAAATNSYTLTDRGTWLAFNNKQNLTIILEGEDGLQNPYGIILVNPKKFPHIKAKLANQFIDWMISKTGQKAIGEFRINGQQIFCPNIKELKIKVPQICPKTHS